MTPIKYQHNSYNIPPQKKTMHFGADGDYSPKVTSPASPKTKESRPELTSCVGHDSWDRINGRLFIRKIVLHGTVMRLIIILNVS